MGQLFYLLTLAVVVKPALCPHPLKGLLDGGVEPGRGGFFPGDRLRPVAIYTGLVWLTARLPGDARDTLAVSQPSELAVTSASAVPGFPRKRLARYDRAIEKELRVFDWIV